MKTVKISALVLAMAGIFATSANAQSAKANAWEGAYGQVGVGYGSFTPKIGNGSTDKVIGLGPTYANVTASASNVNTGTANLSAGYNFGINSDYILGVGVSYYPGASSSAPGTFTFTTPGGTPLQSGPATYNVKNLYSVFLSPGYVIDKDRLAYLKVGYTGATIGLNGPTLSYSTINLTGYTLGLGYKQMITQSLYMLGEFNYAGYSNKTVTLTQITGTNLTAPFGGSGIDFLVGVGYRF
jgi:outer membrane immunogenic protein